MWIYMEKRDILKIIFTFGTELYMYFPFYLWIMTIFRNEGDSNLRIKERTPHAPCQINEFPLNAIHEYNINQFILQL